MEAAGLALKHTMVILELGLDDIVKDARNIVAIEWPEKIKKVLPRDAIKINFTFLDKNKREIKF